MTSAEIKDLNKIWSALHKANQYILNDSHAETLVETIEMIKESEEIIKKMIKGSQ